MYLQIKLNPIGRIWCSLGNVWVWNQIFLQETGVIQFWLGLQDVQHNKYELYKQPRAFYDIIIGLFLIYVFSVYFFAVSMVLMAEILS